MKTTKFLSASFCSFCLLASGQVFSSDSVSCDDQGYQNITTIGEVDSYLIDYLAGHCFVVDDVPVILQGKQLSKNALKSDVLFIKDNKDKYIFDDTAKITEQRNLINNALEKGNKLLLIDFEPDELSALIGVEGKGFEMVMVRKHGSSLLVEPLGAIAGNDEYSDFSMSQSVSRELSSDGQLHTITDNSVDEFVENHTEFAGKTLYSRVLKSLNTDHYPSVERLKSATASLSDTDSDLPTSQVKKNYLYLDRSAAITDTQSFTNNVTIEYTIMASFNPYKKYLRLVTLGAGMNPTSGHGMDSDSDYNRGYFHNKVNITMKSQDASVKLLTHSPSNINSQTTYTASSSVTVGVDISKNPGFNASYTVGQSESRTISDFDIQNNSSGSKATWNYQLGRSKNNKFDMFYSPGVFRKDKVHGIPNLGKLNMQPISVSLWEAGGNTTGSKKFELNWSVEYMRCRVTGDWVSFTRHWDTKTRNWGWWSGNPVGFNFSSVSS